MRTRLSFIFLLFICCSHFSYAQQCIIKGKVQDTLNQSYLPHAAVTLVRAADSVMETFARTKDDGSFELKAATGDRYLIMITYPGFADYVDIITVKDGKTKDMGNVPMLTRSHLLTEFVFQQNRGAIKVKGDTIEYVADSFKTKDNATVEDLLKKLPGMQVDKNGQVTAQGEKVQKILVDGEEFFSDDPAVVTKNLQANAVDKVQVFDKKSDQAEFTGIDDGIKTKTIDLKLKEDKKKGYFGKAVAGGGGNGSGRGFYENQAMINAFKGKRQLSAFGIISNTGKTGLSWQDADKFGGSNSSSILADASSNGDMTFFYNNNNDDFESWNGTYNGQGLPRVFTGGLHYANKWNESKSHVSANYRFSNQDINTEGNTITDYLLSHASQTNTESRKISSAGMRHNADALYETKIDSTSDIKITASAGYFETKKTSDYFSALQYTNVDSTLSGIWHDGDTVNTGTRHVSSDANTKKENLDLIYRKRFKKKGRTVSLSLAESYREDNSTGFLNSTSSLKFYDSVQYTDQKKLNTNNVLSAAAKVDYTEPLSKVAFLEFNYTSRVDNSKAKRTSLDKGTDPANEYTNMVDSLSNNYEYNVFTNSGGANIRFVFKKMNLSAGGSIANAHFRQDNLAYGLQKKDTTFSYNYLNFFPRVNFNYKFASQANLYITYNGATKQPTITQIQPLKDNSDPLNQTVGNPNLKQEFRHTITTRYNDYKILSGRYIWMNASFTAVQNAITRVDNVADATGKRVSQYENKNGNYLGWGYLGYGIKIPKTPIQAGVFGNLSIAHTNTTVNAQANTSNNNSYTGGFRFNYDKSDKFSLSLTPQVTYNDNKATISTYSTNYWNTQVEFEGSYQLPLKFEIGSDVDWYVRQRTEVFTKNNNVFRWNAYVSKKFMKKSQLELRLSAYDILNQNKGFNRYAQSNYTYEDNYNTVSRYGLLSLIWNFTKTPAGTPAPEGGGGMIFRK